MNPFGSVWNLLKQGWGVLRTVYWYNSLPWRFLKAGGLLVFGFFCLSGGNLLYSFKPDWTFLHYLIAYGFLLIPYGPIHHLLVIPVSLRLGHYQVGRTLKLGKRIPFWTLVLFALAVGWSGYTAPDVMTFEFDATSLSSTPDVNPEVTCYRSGEESDAVIHCRLPAVEGIERVEVENDGRSLLVVEDPPYEFEIKVSDLEEVVGQRNFHVVLRDQHGSMIRRYVRSASMVDVRSPSSDTAP